MEWDSLIDRKRALQKSSDVLQSLIQQISQSSKLSKESDNLMESLEQEEPDIDLPSQQQSQRNVLSNNDNNSNSNNIQNARIACLAKLSVMLLQSEKSDGTRKGLLVWLVAAANIMCTTVSSGVSVRIYQNRQQGDRVLPRDVMLELASEKDRKDFNQPMKFIRRFELEKWGYLELYVLLDSRPGNNNIGVNENDIYFVEQCILVFCAWIKRNEHRLVPDGADDHRHDQDSGNNSNNDNGNSINTAATPFPVRVLSFSQAEERKPHTDMDAARKREGWRQLARHLCVAKTVEEVAHALKDHTALLFSEAVNPPSLYVLDATHTSTIRVTMDDQHGISSRGPAVGVGLIGWVAAHATPISIVEKAEEDRRFDVQWDCNKAGVMARPIFLQNNNISNDSEATINQRQRAARVFAVLELTRSNSIPFDAADQETFERLCNKISEIIKGLQAAIEQQQRKPIF